MKKNAFKILKTFMWKLITYKLDVTYKKLDNMNPCYPSNKNRSLRTCKINISNINNDLVLWIMLKSLVFCSKDFKTFSTGLKLTMLNRTFKKNVQKISMHMIKYNVRPIVERYMR